MHATLQCEVLIGLQLRKQIVFTDSSPCERRRSAVQHRFGEKGGVKAAQHNEQHSQESWAPQQRSVSSIVVHALARMHTHREMVAVLPLMDRGFRDCCNRVSLQWLRRYSCRVYLKHVCCSRLCQPRSRWPPWFSDTPLVTLLNSKRLLFFFFPAR